MSPSSGDSNGNDNGNNEKKDNTNTDASKRWRVKLYELDPQGAWLDRGTGGAALVDNGPESDSSISKYCISVVDEEENCKVILNSPLKMQDIYERQGENIIMWR
jgi:hypothetical protein